jgi:hypothetical protein
MNEDLLGYLLDAIDDAERQRIDEALREDPQLQRQLEDLKRDLDCLDTAPRDFEPPSGLVERTCGFVDAHKEAQLVTPVSGRRWVGRSCRMSPERGVSARSWSMADAVVVAGIVVVVSMLFFPAIANSRYRSHIAGCQFNLQRLGGALTEYSDRKGGLLPEIPVSGNCAVAGIYGPMLVEGQFLTDPKILICPGSGLAARSAGWQLPSFEELDQARGRQLVSLQRAAGGSYGYTLGYLADGQYRAPRYEGRANFALMSDAPSLHLEGRRTEAHGGRGQNVLFEDNRVEFIVDCVAYDALFVNREGFASAGLDENDSVIARSNTPPLIH